MGSHKLEFNGIPFSIGGKRILDCQYGVQYKKPKPPTSSRVFLQGSRKKGCRAHIEITEFNLYPEYSTKSKISPLTSQKQARKVREVKLGLLQQALAQGQMPQVVNKYYIRLPTEEAHHKCHPTKGAMGFSQRIHPELIAKIQEMVSAGITDAVQVQRLLRHHVYHYMCVSNPLPDPNDRAYHPAIDDIRNHINRARQVLKLSVIDQENAIKKIEQWKELSPESKFVFRPYRGKTGTDAKHESLDNTLDSSLEKNLLWVHQEPWQQQLMLKYRNTISLMDATYKTTRYELPLFFISVRTNTGYCVVADFIVQSESAACIEEALGVLRTWNPNWKPNFFMTDYSEAEIAALEASFPGTIVYLCDFHREQAWERWTKDRKHGLSTLEAEWLLNQLRACAWAPSAAPGEGVPADYYFQQAVEALQHSNLWKTNENVRQWVTSTWLSMSKVINTCTIRECSIYLFTFLYTFHRDGPGYTEIHLTMLQSRPTMEQRL